MATGGGTSAVAGPSTSCLHDPGRRTHQMSVRQNTPGIRYATSPLLASKTPVWRSRFIVGGMAAGFLLLGCRAAYVDVFHNEYFIHQGEVRFARTLELPASRGRILDRNGQILAADIA